MKKSVLLLIILSAFTSLYAQYSSKDKKAIKNYEEASALIAARTNYEKAEDLLRAAVAKDPNFLEAHIKLGGLYKLFLKEEPAILHFEKAAELKPNAKDMAGIYYTVGEYYFKVGNVEKAKNFLDKVSNSGTTDARLLNSTKKLVEKVNYGIEARKHPLDFKPVMMSKVLNNYYWSAYPVLTADQEYLIFTKRDGFGQQNDEDIMISKKINDEWGTPVSISSNINTEFNEGTASISSDGKILVFTSCNRPDGFGSCDLYISYREGEAWSQPLNLGQNVNSTSWDSEASLSADGRKIYFASDRKGGVGDKDIWVTEMDANGEWTVAKNLGSPVNTIGADVAPFIHANGKSLYFSSNTHPGMGGLDIFITQQEISGWTQPKNVGYPLNTPIDDATIFITPDSKKGFYAPYEKKAEKGQPHLYEFEVPEEIKAAEIATYAKGHVYDADSKKVVGASIELIDLKTNSLIQSVKSDAKTGDYLVVLTEGKEYALYVQAEGYLFKSVFFDFKNPAQFNPLTLDVYLEPIKAGKIVVLNNIFFNSNSWQLEDKSRTELEKIIVFMKNNPKVNIELGGHTDDVGSDKDNMDLSMKRAKAVYDYLVSKGIYSGRLKYKGYGETQPAEANTTEESRTKNRRIEFKVL